MENNRNEKLTLFSLTWPIFIEVLLFMLLGFIDIFVLSKYSDDAAAAVGASNQIIMMLNVMFAIVSGGTAVLVAQGLGAEEKEMVSKVISVSIVMNLIIGTVFSIIMFFYGHTILQWMGVNNDLMMYADEYIKIVGGFSFVQAILMTITAVIRSHGYTKISMYVTLGMNTINAIGDIVFVLGILGAPVLGVKGVAIATSFSKCLGLIVMFWILFRNVENVKIIKSLRPFPKKILKDLLKIGIPSASEQLSYDLSQIIITGFILTVLGKEAFTTKTYVQNIIMFGFVFSAAIGQGNQILIGHLIGKGELEEAYNTCLKSLKIAIGFSALMGVLGIALRNQLIGIFTDNYSIVTLGAAVLIVDAILEPGRAFNVVIINGLRAAGDTVFPVIMAGISMWGVSVGIGYFLGIYMKLGLVGMWIAFALDEWFRGICMLGRWKGCKWQSMAFIQKKCS